MWRGDDPDRRRELVRLPVPAQPLRAVPDAGVLAAANRLRLPIEPDLLRGVGEGDLDRIAAARKARGLVLDASAAQAAGEAEAAVPLLVAALDLSPDDPVVRARVERLASGLRQSARSLAEAGDPAGSAAALARLAKLTPGDWKVHFNLGTILASIGRHGDALAAYLEANRLAPEDLDVLLNLGNTYGRLGDAGSAAAIYGAILQRAPRHAEALYNLGLYHEGRGERRQAAELYRRALDASPADPDFRAALRRVGQE